MESSGKKLIGSLQKKWMGISVLSDLLMATAVATIVAAVAEKNSSYAIWLTVAAFAITFLLLAIVHRFWNISEEDIVRYLNNQNQQYQESAQLLLKPAESLNLLQKLQVSRVEQVISQSKLPDFYNRKPVWAGVTVLAAILFAGLSSFLPPIRDVFKNHHSTHLIAGVKPAKAEIKLTAISGLELKIIPPAYTRQSPSEQSDFTLQTVEGSEAVWQVTTNNPVDQLVFIFNDKETVALHASDDSHTKWTLRKTLANPGFYQVKIQDKLSDMYMIDLLKDQLPVVRITAPKQYTTIDFGAPQQVPLRVSVTDDYGIGNTYMTATIASGSGEGVKFKEQRFSFAGFSAGSRSAALQKTIDLRALGMKPGDELYYYVSALDNHRQENRSDIYIITLPDTAQLMEMDGLTNSVNLKQEYFRSERQIIIETEQLLKNKDTMSVANYNNKANDLGMDQKLLRLRYGKFLGEESDNEIGGHHDPDEGAHDEPVFGDATKMIEEFTHKHDNAEDATFFDPKLKAQLKETLSEMWKAELQLRLYKPQEALPFEYKALLLLKDLQQQSRVYVAKAAYKTTPLRPEKRLTADLSKIVEPSSEQTIKQDNQTETAVRKAAGLMEELKQHATLPPLSRKTMQTAANALGNMAVAKPSLYLASFEAIKRVLSGLDRPASIPVPDIHAAEKGLQAMIAGTGKSPRPELAGIRQQLSQQYFRNLQQSNR